MPGTIKPLPNVCAFGVAKVSTVDAEVCHNYNRWFESGGAAGMGYMGNHTDIRNNPALLLDGAHSIICMAFSYAGAHKLRYASLPAISAYALFPDYHDWIRKLIRDSGIGEWLGEEGKDWRICVDSAPIMERYWAVKAGLGFIGDNGALIVPGIGNQVFLAEIITTHELEPTAPFEGECCHCGACRRACPTGALREDGTIDCNRCLSYLTIEHRGEWTDPVHIEAMRTPGARNTLFGCDRCLTVCPHNNPSAQRCPAMPSPLQEIVTLTAEDILNSDPTTLTKRLRGSCLKRAKTTGLTRNATNTLLQ